MTDEQRATSVAAIAAAVRLFHTQSALASIMGKSQGHVSRLVAGDVEIDAVDAVTIDQRSSGKIPRHELRPDLWDPPKRSRFAEAPAKMIKVLADRRAILFPGDRIAITGTPFDGEHVVGAVLGDPSRPTKGKQNGETRTRSIKKPEGKETRGRRPAAQRRQGRKAESGKGKGRG